MLFFDESRFGTKSQLGYGWFPRGERTQVDSKQGFENFYLYSAVEPSTGKDFTLFMPHVNEENMNSFLVALAAEIKEKILLIMDGAGWHKSKGLRIPDNIQIMFLPPYSPELNPVERFWLYIKNNTIKNQVFESISDLQITLETFLNKISKEIMKSVCSMINY